MKVAVLGAGAVGGYFGGHRIDLRLPATKEPAFTDEEFEAGIASIQNDPAHRRGTIANEFPMNLITPRRAQPGAPDVIGLGDWPM